MKKTKQNKKPTNKKRIGIALGITIPLVAAGTATGIVFGVKACNSKTTTSVEVTGGATYDAAKSKIAVNEESKIVLTPETGKQIKSVSKVYVDGKEITDYTFDPTTNTITIKASAMTSTKIKIEVVTEPIVTASIELSDKTKTLKLGENFTITATVKGSTSKLDWTLTQGTGGATGEKVDDTHYKVTATKQGNIQVKASLVDDPDVSATCTVVIEPGEEKNAY